MSQIAQLDPRRGNTQIPLLRIKKTIKRSKFLKRIHHFFTYNNYDRSIIPVLIEAFNHLCYMYAFQEETGEQGTPHLQGIISLKRK